uniref:Somatostatin receptor subtype 5 variant 2 n=1 Tax=Mus musculus TaxID=10090 RepID=D7NVX3_MOUSE|nr:somatostatin receptor subtype 5 variant 2 [Mus musculus]
MEPLSLTSTPSWNASAASSSSHNWSLVDPVSPMGARAVLVPVLYLLVCTVGLGGNTLVIYVVLRYAKMKTVTNVYILNLAVADVLFMLGLSFLATQNAVSYWPFGSFLCRLVMTLDGINQFTRTVASFLSVSQAKKQFFRREPRNDSLVDYWCVLAITHPEAVLACWPLSHCSLFWSAWETNERYPCVFSPSLCEPAATCTSRRQF